MLEGKIGGALLRACALLERRIGIRMGRREAFERCGFAQLDRNTGDLRRKSVGGSLALLGADEHDDMWIAHRPPCFGAITGPHGENARLSESIEVLLNERSNVAEFCHDSSPLNQLAFLDLNWPFVEISV